MPGPNGLENVYVVMADAGTGTVFYEGRATLVEVIQAMGALGGDMTVTISTDIGNPSAPAPGATLQTMTIATACTEANDLTLNKIFGGLDLVGYKNSAVGVYDAVSLLITYVLENQSTNVEANATSAQSTSSTSGTQQFINAPPLVLPPTQRVSYTEQVVVDLSNPDPEYTYLLQVAGVGSLSGLACSDESSFSFTVGS